MVKNNITVAALRLFLLRGYKYVSIVDIANEVGITKGGVYHYFSSKEDLLHAAVQCLFDHFKKKFLELFSEEKNLRETLHAIIVEQEMENYIRTVLGMTQENVRTHDGNFSLEVMQHFPQIHKRIDQDQLEICSAIGRSLQRALQRGKLREDLDIHAVSIIIFTVMNGDKPLRIFFNDLNTRKRIMESLCNMIGI